MELDEQPIICLSTSVEKVPSIVSAVDVVFLVVVKQGGSTCAGHTKNTPYRRRPRV